MSESFNRPRSAERPTTVSAPDRDRKDQAPSGPKEGDLRIWWKPQIPCRSFYVPVSSLREAVLVYDTLARYDRFQHVLHVKGDFANGGGLQEFIPDLVGDAGSDGWVDWYDHEEGDDFIEYKDAHPELLDAHPQERGARKSD